MPYRRLPNTDMARLRALKSALAKVDDEGMSTLAFTTKTAMTARSFTPVFEQAVQMYNNSKEAQAQASKAVGEAGKVARLYVSHYIQVFNLCIARGEIKPEARALLGMDEATATVPDMTADQQLLEWGRKVIEGEGKRMSSGGGTRIYNPSIALVKVKMDMFEEKYNRHRDLLGISQKFHDKLDEVRQKADEIILSIWNEVEATFSPIDTEEKRRACQDYGVVYFYRPNERQRDFLMGKI